jgi:hypothetical protein
LPDIHDLQESPVTFTNFEDISKYVINKFIQPVATDHRRIGVAERAKEVLPITINIERNKAENWVHRFNKVKVSNILFFFTDDLVDNPAEKARQREREKLNAGINRTSDD